MSLREYSNTRTKATWKPRVQDADLRFVTCPDRGATYLGVGSGERVHLSEPGRNPVFNLPYASMDFDDGSCEAPSFLGVEDLPAGVSLDYAIVGGYNNNAIEFSWRVNDPENAPLWVALKTFTGFQVKYLTPKKRSPLIFALADEDAYVYCDESPCLECIFMCKRGFVLYACLDNLGIVRIPLERASAHWESR